jgi:hypothetical protein
MVEALAGSCVVDLPFSRLNNVSVRGRSNASLRKATVSPGWVRMRRFARGDALDKCESFHIRRINCRRGPRVGCVRHVTVSLYNKLASCVVYTCSLCAFNSSMTSPYAATQASPVGGEAVPLEGASSSQLPIERTLSEESQIFGEALIARSKEITQAWYENKVLQSESGSFQPDDDEEEEEEDEGPWVKQSVLCFDGGGIWGYSSLLILAKLMREIRDLEMALIPAARTSSDSPLIEGPISPRATERSSLTSSHTHDFLPCHYFDYIAGTSTGGLIAIMLGRLRMNC